MINVPKAFELAIAAVLRRHAELGASTSVRPWQSLREDWLYTEGDQGDRHLPCIDIRCAPPTPGDETPEHRTVTAEIAIMTHAADDQDHAMVSEIYGEVQAVVDRLLDASYACESTDPVFSEFAAQMGLAGLSPEALLGGALLLGDGTTPGSGDTQHISLAITLHYTHCPRKREIIGDDND